jgi:predicted dehydrogenase
MLLALIEMEGGVQGVVDCSKVGAARSGRFEFVCKNGQLHGDQIYNTCREIHHSEQTAVDPGEPVGTIIPLLRDWRDFLRDQGPNPISGSDGLKAVSVCEACLRSARQKMWVDVEGE